MISPYGECEIIYIQGTADGCTWYFCRECKNSWNTWYDWKRL